jgi:hypothetical protein
MNLFAETNASRSTSVYLRLCSNPMLERLVSMESVTPLAAILICFKLSTLLRLTLLRLR